MPTPRNSFEEGLGDQLRDAGIAYGYESIKLEVAHPPRKARYTPDFVLDDCNIIIESKGYFYGGAADRAKLLLVKQQYPEIDLRIVFENPQNKIYKGSKTTYAQWADKNGFKWAAKCIPTEWLMEIREQQQQRSAIDDYRTTVRSCRPSLDAASPHGAVPSAD